MKQPSSIFVQLGLFAALQLSAPGQQAANTANEAANSSTLPAAGEQPAAPATAQPAANPQPAATAQPEANAQPAATPQTTPASGQPESASDKPAAVQPSPQGLYAEPDISDAAIPVIRRSKLPLEKERMLACAAQLKQLLGVGKQTPADWQNRARIVALISALNADEAELGKINNELKKQTIPALPELQQYQNSLQALWQLCQQLSNCEENSEGKKLHACLLDILSQIDSSNPLAKQDSTDAESRWSPVVKQLAEFSPKLPGSESQPASKPADSEKPQLAALSPKLARSSVSMPMFCDPQSGNLQILGKMELTHSGITNQGDCSTEVKFEPDINGRDRLVQNYQKFAQYAKKRWPNWPKGGEFKVVLPAALHDYESNSNFLGLSVALMFESSFSGNLAANTTVSLARLEADGKLTSSRHWWRAVNMLAPQNKEMRTLLTTPKTGEKLANLLVIGKPEFFLVNECIGVETFEEAVAATLSPSETRKKNAASFNEIRTIYNEKRMSVPAMCSNIYVRERLQKILESEPKHISATMLLLQGDSIKRPQKLSAEVVARVIKDAIQPTIRDLGTYWEHKPENEWESIADKAQSELEDIKKYYDKEQQELFNKTMQGISELRSCARNMRVIKNANDDERKNRAKQQAQQQHQNAKRTLERVREMCDLELK